jgi:hypothetical protein
VADDQHRFIGGRGDQVTEIGGDAGRVVAARRGRRPAESGQVRDDQGVVLEQRRHRTPRQRRLRPAVEQEHRRPGSATQVVHARPVDVDRVLGELHHAAV